MTEQEFLDKKKWSLPYNEKDLTEAIEFGKQLMLAEIKAKVIGMVVNGTTQGVVLEKEL